MCMYIHRPGARSFGSHKTQGTARRLIELTPFFVRRDSGV